MAMNRMPRILSFDWSRCRQVKLYHVLRREKLGCCDDLLFIYQQCSADDETNQSAAAISNDQDGETTKTSDVSREGTSSSIRHIVAISISHWHALSPSHSISNEHDEKDFHEREQDRLEPKQKKDVRLSMLSMLPPCGPDEL
jgi:hypothetical protein